MKALLCAAVLAGLTTPAHAGDEVHLSVRNESGVDVGSYKIVTSGPGGRGGDGGASEYLRPISATEDAAKRRSTSDQVSFTPYGCNFRIEVRFSGGRMVATQDADLCVYHTLVIGPSGLVSLRP